jgi:hypothetical protein
MIQLEDYTMKIWVKDRRRKDGERLYATYEYPQKHEQWMNEEVRDLEAGAYPAPKYRIEVRKTWVTRKNVMTGKEFKERFDTPYYCSPSSETYWSM